MKTSSTMGYMLDPAIDERIRIALKDADAKDKLGIVAAVSSIAGGEERLRQIMESTEELDLMDRASLGMYLV